MVYVLIRLVTYGYYRQISEETLVRGPGQLLFYGKPVWYCHGKNPWYGRDPGTHWLNLKIDAINSGIKLTRWICSSGNKYFVAACDQMAILWLGASLVIDNQMTIGMFVAFGSFRGQFSDRVASLTSFFFN